MIDMTKAQIVSKGLELGVDYTLTLSCYDPTPDGTHCGACAACVLRAKGYAQAGAQDPALDQGM